MSLRYRRRGRPKSTHRPQPSHERSWRDPGTPEMIAKRACHITSEALDLCLERSLITAEQHWCGVHLRWLYTLRFGAPGIRALDTTHLGGKDLQPEHQDWRSAREAEYHEALKTLGPGLSGALLSLTVYNIAPLSLQSPQAGRTLRQAAAWATRARLEMETLRNGFTQLVTLWCRTPDTRGKTSCP